MRTTRAALLAAACLAVAACANNQQNGTVVGAVAGGLIGNTVGHGNGKVLATIAGAVVGGVVGSAIGRRMDEHDREMARRAEMDAWENGESGHPVRWRNPDNGRYGEVIPDRPYRRGPQDCRDYTHRVWIDGRPEEMRGTACRNGDGTWTSVG
jgi:surface antigen